MMKTKDEADTKIAEKRRTSPKAKAEGKTENDVNQLISNRLHG